MHRTLSTRTWFVADFCQLTQASYWKENTYQKAYFEAASGESSQSALGSIFLFVDSLDHTHHDDAKLLKGSAKQLEDSLKIVEHFCVWRGSYQKLTQ
jgi:hypothetical protein